MRLSEELAAAALLIERQQHEFDKEWIAGVRKAWQQLYKERTKFKGRVAKSRYKSISDQRDHKTVQAAAKAVESYLKRVKKFLEDLQQDLLINKGLWMPPEKGGAAKHDFTYYGSSGKIERTTYPREQSTIVRGLHNAIKSIEIPNTERFGHHNFVKYPWSDHPAYAFSADVRDMNDILRGLNNRADEQVKKVNGSLNRSVWKPLNAIIDKYGKGRGTDADNPMSLGSGFEPTELNIGKARIKFESTPLDPVGLSKKTQMKHGRKVWEDPVGRKETIAGLIKAQALLRKRGLDQIWYGDFHIKAHGGSYKFKDAKGKARNAAADYDPSTDSVRVFGNYNARDVGIIVHELGHRYYYKVMSQKDRDAFNKWYAKVKATSEYGASSTVEDFAEVFMEYVLGKMKLDRDQIERFESVLKGKIIHDEPAMTGTSLDSPRTTKYHGIPIVFFDTDVPVPSSPSDSHYLDKSRWRRSLEPIRVLNMTGIKNLKSLWRHGVVIRKPRGGFPVADYDKKAGVLTLHMETPLSSDTVVKNIGLAYYYSDFVTPKMRAAWEDLWTQRKGTKIGGEAAAKRFGYELSQLANGKSLPPKSLHMVYWMLGDQDQPSWVDDTKNQPFVVPTPRQMHQRSRMKMVGMEWKKGPLSSALVEALCS